MAMDIIALGASKKYTNLVALGLSDVSVSGTTVTFTLNDGETASITLPTPANGIDGKSLEFNWNGTQLGIRVEGTENYSYVDLKGSNGTNGTNGTNGINGEDGTTPNIQIGTVSTLSAGSSATATMTGTTENPLLNLGIPKGADGQGGGTGVGSETTCEFHVESKYYACVGAEFNIYYDDITLVKNQTNIYFVTSKTSGNATIQTFDDCVRITPSASALGDNVISVKAYKKDSGDLISEQNINISVINVPTYARPVKVMFIGDSLTNGGWQNTLKTLIPDDIVLYGTLGGGTSLHEGRVSWSAHNYCHDASYNSMTNPFYNSSLTTDSKFDFNYYMTNNTSFADVDYVNIFLGRNYNYGLDEVNMIKNMVDSVKSYNSDILITLTLGYHIGHQPYQSDSYKYSYTQRKITYDFNDKMHEIFDGYTNVYLVPQFINIDNVYDHPNSSQALSNRNTTNNRIIVSDTVHFSDAGYKKLADSYFPLYSELNTLYPKSAIESDVDKTALVSAISSANTNLSSVSISTDGTDVATNLYWVTQSVYDIYNTSIQTASTVNNSSTSTQTDVDGAVTTLASATTTFNNAKASGTEETTVFVLPDYSQTNYPTYVIVQDLQYTDSGSVPKYWLYATHCPTMTGITFDQYNNYLQIKFNDSSTANNTTTYIKYTSNDGTTWSQDGGISRYASYVTTSILKAYALIVQTSDGTKQSTLLDYSSINLWESGDYSYQTGTKVDATARIRIKDLIDVSSYSSVCFNLGNSAYTVLMRTYASDGTFVSAKTSSVFTTTTGVSKVGIAVYNGSNSALTFADYEALFESGDIKPMFIAQ